MGDYQSDIHTGHKDERFERKGTLMIGYIGVEEQVDKDFNRAFLKASLHHWKDRLLRDSARRHPAGATPGSY